MSNFIFGVVTYCNLILGPATLEQYWGLRETAWNSKEIGVLPQI
jgi:hypothetical protein